MKEELGTKILRTKIIKFKSKIGIVWKKIIKDGACSEILTYCHTLWRFTYWIVSPPGLVSLRLIVLALTLVEKHVLNRLKWTKKYIKSNQTLFYPIYGY